jgi:hypothetical protein
MRRLEDVDWGIRLGLAGGQLRVWPEAAAVVTQSKGARSELVRPAVLQIVQRFGPNGEMRLPHGEFRRLLAYLALELAASARHDHRLPRILWHLISSYMHKPRLSVHLKPWWARRNSSPEELRQIEELGATME